MVMGPILPVTMTGGVVRRRGKTLLGPVDLTLGAQGCTIIMGPNGAGKTTLLRALHGLERLSAGRIDWAMPAVETRARQAFVFQAPVMLRRDVLDNIAYPLRLTGVARAQARAQALDWAQRVGLGVHAQTPAHLLSGGEKQKLALARALIRDPAIVFLDEPCANLDGQATREIEAILQHAKARGTRLVMATHHLGQARRLADDVIFLHHGQIIEQAPADVFFNAAQTPQARGFLNGDIVT
jgi:tungstate transport system ATP-binding protein